MIDLHVHTKFSLLDSIIEPEDLIKMSKDMGRNAVCVTEHGNLYSSVETYKLCQKYGLKYIMGCEVYICDDVNVKDKNNRYNHLVLLAKNEQGRLNLIELVSQSNKYKYYGKPRIDFEMLERYSEGLIVLSACMAGEVMKALENGDTILAEAIALKYKNVFGEDYYLEIQSHKDKTQQKLNRQIVDLANKLNIEYVVSTDSHYLTAEDQKYHNIFVQIGTTREVGETYNDCFIQSDKQILETCQSTTEDENIKAIKNTYTIADKCNVTIPLSDPIMPHVDIPKGFNSEIEYLKYLCAKGWHDRNINRFSIEKQKEYKDRLNYEMNAIEKMNFQGYFLLVQSYATSVKRRGIARGSGGGSLVAYLSHIIDVDPIEYGLYFERFIDVGALDLLEEGLITPSELKLPDFDLDFGKTDRDKVIKSIVSQYGEEKYASLGQFSYIWAKGAIKDIGKVLGIPYDVTNEMTKPLGDLTIEDALAIGLLDEYIDKYPELFTYVKKLAGLPKSFGSHPCGKIICMDKVKYYNSVEYDDDGNYILQGDMHTADNLGLVKIDLLGLRTVDVIYDTLDMIGKDYEYIAPHKMDFNDRKVLEQFKLGNTSEIFQFSSVGMQGTLRNMEVNSFDDITAANALFRPGSMDFINDYAERKRGLVEFEYLHPDLEKILEPTYAIIIFQEQLIEIGKIADLKNPDLLRQATGKKDQELMKKIYPELRNNLISRGWTTEQVEELWNIMLNFAKYSFNKSHSAAYAMIAYISMYLKVYHPKEYMVASINSYNGKIENISICIKEIKRLGIQIEVPSWRDITSKTVVRDGVIYTGTETIKFLNANIANELNKLSRNKYNSLFDFLMDLSKTEATDKHVEILAKLGCFSEFGSPSRILQARELLTYLPKKQINKNQIDKTPFTLEQLKRYGKETEKQIRNIDFTELVCEAMERVEDKEENIIDTVKTEIKYLGYAKSTSKNIAKDVGIVSKLEQNQWGTTFIDLYRFNGGEVDKLKITKAVYQLNPIHELDTIKTITVENQHKKRKIDGKWTELDETENILIKWSKVVA